MSISAARAGVIALWATMAAVWATPAFAIEPALLAAVAPAENASPDSAYAHHVKFGAVGYETAFGAAHDDAFAPASGAGRVAIVDARVKLGGGKHIIEARYTQTEAPPAPSASERANRELALTYSTPIGKGAYLDFSAALREESTSPIGLAAGRTDEMRSVAARIGAHWSLGEDDRDGKATHGDHGVISEIAGGVFAHDEGPFGAAKESGVDLNAEVLFKAPSMLRWAGSPRPHVGVMAATGEDATSYAYAGLTWEHDLPAKLFAFGSLGGAIHNGDPLNEDDAPPSKRAQKKFLGSRVLFRESFGVGRRMGDHWRAALQLEHLSNLNLAESNEGLDNIGVRVSYRF